MARAIETCARCSGAPGRFRCPADQTKACTSYMAVPNASRGYVGIRASNLESKASAMAHAVGQRFAGRRPHV